jgi:hypothetical protein
MLTFAALFCRCCSLLLLGATSEYMWQCAGSVCLLCGFWQHRGSECYSGKTAVGHSQYRFAWLLDAYEVSPHVSTMTAGLCNHVLLTWTTWAAQHICRRHAVPNRALITIIRYHQSGAHLNPVTATELECPLLQWGDQWWLPH